MDTNKVIKTPTLSTINPNNYYDNIDIEILQTKYEGTIIFEDDFLAPTTVSKPPPKIKIPSNTNTNTNIYTHTNTITNSHSPTTTAKGLDFNPNVAADLEQAFLTVF